MPFAVHITLDQDYLPRRLAISAGGLLAPALGVLADAYGQRLTLTSLIAAPPLALAATRGLRARDSHR